MYPVRNKGPRDRYPGSIIKIGPFFRSNPSEGGYGSCDRIHFDITRNLIT